MPKARVYLALGILSAIVAGVAAFGGLFSGLENFLEDTLFTRKPVSPDIVLVAIDDDSIQSVGQWPWPREVFAKALLNIDAVKPKAVAVDVVLAEPSRLGEGDDTTLVSALNGLHYPLIFPTEARDFETDARGQVQAGAFLFPRKEFLNAPTLSLGHVNIISDPDGTVRRLPRIIGDGEGNAFRAFAYEAVARSKLPIIDRTHGEMIRIVYAASPGSIRKIPFSEVLKGNVSALAGKIVFIGSIAPSLHDEKPTPFTRGVQMPGVEIQAQIANMFLKGYALSPVPVWEILLIIALAALLPAVGFIILQRIRYILPLTIFLFVAILVVGLIFFEQGLVISLLHTELALIISSLVCFTYDFVSTEHEKTEIKRIFAKYVSPKVLDEILRDPRKVMLGGEEREITLLFSDIRGFTTLSEKTTPQNLVRILNKYFTAMTNEVLSHDGVLDKYIGDAIMAFWGAPIPDEDQADKAIQTALAMIEKLKIVNQELRAAGDPEINIGIGLYSGPAVVGNVGSDLRFDYTAMGDTVNAASRLEGVTKEFKVKLIVGEATMKKAKGTYDFRSLGNVSVKGRAEPITIYTIGNEPLYGDGTH